MKNFKQPPFWFMAHIYTISFFIFLTIPSTATSDITGTPTPNPSNSTKILEQYFNNYSAKKKNIQADFPGLMLGSQNEIRNNLFVQSWPYRTQTYEIFYASQIELAEMIYGPALFIGDLDKSVTLDRFKKGGQGFHYSVEQLTEWANFCLSKTNPFYTPAEKTFFEYLQRDGVICKRGSQYYPCGQIKHILGAAQSTKRDFKVNLNHERLHVVWDQKTEFRNYWQNKWVLLSEEEKKQVYGRLKGYNPANTLQIIEEWAVYENENKPIMSIFTEGGDNRD